MVNFYEETLFWHDRWLNGQGPMFLWPDAFKFNQNHSSTLRALASMLSELLFSKSLETVPYRDRLASYRGYER